MQLKRITNYFSSTVLFFCVMGTLMASPNDIKKPLSAQKIDIGVMLMWSTSSEAGADVFVLEKSLDGIDYQMLSQVKPTGTSSKGSEYSFVDLFPENDVVFYRLKMLYTDGRATAYQPVQAMNIPPTNFMISKMNDTAPSKNWAIQLEMMSNGALKYELESIDGVIIDKGIKRVKEGYNRLTFSLAEWPDGVYTLNMEMMEDRKSLTIQKIGEATIQLSKNTK